MPLDTVSEAGARVTPDEGYLSLAVLFQSTDVPGTLSKARMELSAVFLAACANFRASHSVCRTDPLLLSRYGEDDLDSCHQPARGPRVGVLLCATLRGDLSIHIRHSSANCAAETDFGLRPNAELPKS
jgi:hypothetical protein